MWINNKNNTDLVTLISKHRPLLLLLIIIQLKFLGHGSVSTLILNIYPPPPPPIKIDVVQKHALSLKNMMQVPRATLHLTINKCKKTSNTRRTLRDHHHQINQLKLLFNDRCSSKTVYYYFKEILSHREHLRSSPMS